MRRTFGRTQLFAAQLAVAVGVDAGEVLAPARHLVAQFGAADRAVAVVVHALEQAALEGGVLAHAVPALAGVLARLGDFLLVHFAVVVGVDAVEVLAEPFAEGLGLDAVQAAVAVGVGFGETRLGLGLPFGAARLAVGIAGLGQREATGQDQGGADQGLEHEGLRGGRLIPPVPTRTPGARPR